MGTCMQAYMCARVLCMMAVGSLDSLHARGLSHTIQGQPGYWMPYVLQACHAQDHTMTLAALLPVTIAPMASFPLQQVLIMQQRCVCRTD